MPPHRLAGVEPVAGDQLFLAALLLRVDELALDREGRPGGADRAAPQRDRRGSRPVGRDPHAADDAVAGGSAEARPVGVRRSRHRGRRCRGRCRGSVGRAVGTLLGRLCSWRRRSRGRLARRSRLRFDGRLRCGRRREGLAALGEQPLLGRRRPAPMEVRAAFAADSGGADEREHGAPEQESGDQPRAPRPGREAASRRRPGHEREAQERDGEEVEHVPHARPRDGRVHEGLDRQDRERREDERAHALEPGRPAEEQPPDHDDQREEGRAEQPPHRSVGCDAREEEPHPHQHDGDDAGPQPQRLPERDVGGVRGHGELLEGARDGTRPSPRRSGPGECRLRAPGGSRSFPGAPGPARPR